MTSGALMPGGGSQVQILDALPHPLVLVGPQGEIEEANTAAENFFRASAQVLRRHPIAHFVPFGSPLLLLLTQVRERGTPVNEYKVDIGSPRIGAEKVVDIMAAPVADRPGFVVLMLQERGMAEKIDRQLTSRGAARTVSGLATMLAHEIKNPLSGIRGAAQLLEASADEDDRPLTRLIMDETDRIVKLVDRMEVFSDERPIEREPLNIHVVLDRVQRLATSGFARNQTINVDYDPSLPQVLANRDQLVQVFLNLVKNASEALSGQEHGEITLTTAYRPGIRLAVPGSREKVSLPLEFCVRDNGIDGVPEELLPHLFDPFVTTKANGSGLGLALVAKIIGDHGGVIECDSQPGRTVFRILMPAHVPGDER
ncbi:nitrogen regulation protein NR(II) [Stappia taiwanensis]|uniref:histidine kinase n=1 Tax=Stappia taiwanensis TaxID=992267 RepID=A0A838Y1V6_9HYPH|nr:nitrogen regulation protein NR(II) [Stappia taiwanensis]MBA4613184.1 nitrogen regulation protein NR(II) [Stappia taiwanensis]GGE79747.1 ATPase [Stappia taiwanensis]